MRLNAKLFGSRVARRIFAAFVFAGLVPIAAMALLALVQVTSTLEDQALRHVQDTSRSIGQQLLDRLLIADSALGQTSGDADTYGAVLIDAAYIQTAAGGIVPMRGDLSPVHTFGELTPGKSTLVTRPNGHGYEVLLAKHTREGIVVGRVYGEHLWGTTDLLPYGMELCVLARELTEPVFCTMALPADARRVLDESIAHTSSGNVYWELAGVPQLATHWDLFLPSRFNATPWTIVVSQPAEIALESLSAFSDVFQQAVLLSLIIVLLLSAQQIRRVLEPLNQLVVGTQRIAERDFSTRFELKGKDEFSDLGHAMNDMTHRLGRQFDTLTTLKQIDKLILSSRSIEQVLEVFFERVTEIIPKCELSVTLIDADEGSRGRLYALSADGTGKHEITRIEIPEKMLTWLSAHSEGHLVTDEEAQAYLGPIVTGRANGPAAVLPMHRDDTLRGVVVGQFSGAASGDDFEIELLREFANRLSVAVSAVDRERELFNRAHFDLLTGLPNRQLCHDRLSQAVAHARRAGRELAVLFIDLDGFKNINDSLGHSRGDELLRETAHRLSSVLRETDTVARLGGDEYVVILPHIRGALEVEGIAKQLLNAVQQPFVIGGQESFVGASIGVTMYPHDATTVEQLLRKADTAMYTAKDAGRGRWAFFAEDMDQRVHERLAMQTDLRNALENEELHLVFQPQISLRDRKLVCAEALVRWNHPTRGNVPPGIFVPILEETGLIEAVGAWVLKSALAELVQWRKRGIPIERVSVNVAMRQLFLRGFAGEVEAMLRAAGLVGRDLELELTEHGLVTDFEHTNRVFRELRANGVRIAIDDFGTGYSSLVYLQEITFDVLKIDRAFVSALPDEKSMAIVQAVLAVARALGKKVVAEGVELDVQERLLEGLGCDIGQGFLFGRPLKPADFIAWAERQATLAPADLGRRAGGT
jgi:diguanylate cyclase (GGDEF)-like protein